MIFSTFTPVEYNDWGCGYSNDRTGDSWNYTQRIEYRGDGPQGTLKGGGKGDGQMHGNRRDEGKSSFWEMFVVEYL